MTMNKDHIEEIIRNNKDVFDEHCSDNHENRFLVKLSRRFKKFISIIPHLFLVFVITFIIFVASIWIWNSYLRKDRHEITLKQKIESILTLKK
jgi:hypothetical protein